MPANPTLPVVLPGTADVWGTTLNQALTDLVAFVNGLETSKAASAHTHPESDITGLVSDLSAVASALAGKVDTTRTVSAGTGLSGGGDLSANRSLAVSYGSTSGTSCQGNDGRLSDARTPLSHTHSAADVTSGTLAVARGGTGVTTLAALQAALGLGLGAAMYRASTSSTDTASGARTMTGYDTTAQADTGYTVSQGAGTITVPANGIYLCTGQARMSANYNGGNVLLTVNDGTNDVLRGSQFQAGSGGLLDQVVSGTTLPITAGTALRLSIFTSTSTSLVGNSTGSLYYFRVVRVG